MLQEVCELLFLLVQSHLQLTPSDVTVRLQFQNKALCFSKCAFICLKVNPGQAMSPCSCTRSTQALCCSHAVLLDALKYQRFKGFYLSQFRYSKEELYGLIQKTENDKTDRLLTKLTPMSMSPSPPHKRAEICQSLLQFIYVSKLKCLNLCYIFS